MTALRKKIYLGRVLQTARKKAGLSIRELARSARVDATYISKLENRRVPTPSLSVLSRICASLPDSIEKRTLQMMVVDADLEADLMKIDSKLVNLYERKQELISEFIDRVAREVIGVCQLLSEQPELKEQQPNFAKVLRDALVSLDGAEGRRRRP